MIFQFISCFVEGVRSVVPICLPSPKGQVVHLEPWFEDRKRNFSNLLVEFPTRSSPQMVPTVTAMGNVLIWVSLFTLKGALRQSGGQCVVFLITARVSSTVSSRVSLHLSDDTLGLFYRNAWGLVMQGWSLNVRKWLKETYTKTVVSEASLICITMQCQSLILDKGCLMKNSLKRGYATSYKY